MIRNLSYSLKFTILTILIFLVGGVFSFAQKIPTPEEIIGFKPGADYHLATYKQALEYFKALEKASPMIKLFEMGKTEMGQTMIYAVITSAENMAKLERYKEISKKMALTKGLSDEEARQLATEGRSVVYIDGGLHASECATTQHVLQLAYDLLTSQDPSIRLTRDNTILLLAFANPDGMDMLAEWYHPNVGTPYEVSSMPWLYNKYVGHDNNRDFFMLNMKETQNITRLINREWFPQILYNPHQKGPFPARIWVPPYGEPTTPNVHPLQVRWTNQIGCAMGTAFEREGKKGVISRMQYDTWYPGFEDFICHNVISILTETQLYRYATPHFYTLNDFPEEYRDLTTSTFYPNPWEGGWWRLKDAVDYSLTASKAVLHTAAKYPAELLYDRYMMGKDVIARFQKESPYAWIIPQEQWDPPTAALMLNKMIMQGIEVYKADESFASDGISYPSGTWVIPMNQAFGLFVKNLFEVQSYPDLIDYPYAWQSLVRPQKFPEAYLPPYDETGWTFSYLMGVKILAANSPLKTKLSRVEKVTPSVKRATRSAKYAYLISSRNNNSFIAVNRILKKNGQVLRTRESFSVGGKTYPPGSFIVLSRSVSGSFIESLSKEFFIDIKGTGDRVSAKTYKLRVPKVALYKSWVSNMDEGWTRWLFEQFEFPFTNIHDARVKSGELRKNFDVIVIPAQSTDAIVNGHKSGTMPAQYVGGITSKGVKNLKQFVEEGGILVTLNGACMLAVDKLGLPVRDALKGVRPPRRREIRRARPPEFVCPGSLLKVEFDSKHPVAYGMPEEAAAFFTRSPAFAILPSFEGEKAPKVIAKYPKGSLLMSGYLKGEKYLQNKVSAVEVPLGKGAVILLGFAVQSRAQSHGTFKLLFNSLYYGSSK